MSAKQIRVLIVDDSEICCETAKLMLEEEGLEVFTLSTPIGFSANLQNLRPDIALVDVAMPAMRGNQLVDIANRRGAAAVCPVILFSDRKCSELDLLAKSCGATGVICKSDRISFVSLFFEIQVWTMRLCCGCGAYFRVFRRVSSQLKAKPRTSGNWVAIRLSSGRTPYRTTCEMK